MKPLEPVHVRTRSSAWLTAVSQRLPFDILYSHEQLAWHRLRLCGSSLRAQENLTAIWDVEYSLHFASTSPPFRLEFIALHQGVKLQRPQVTSWQHLGLRFGARLHRGRENDEQRSWQENEHDRS